MEAFKMLSKRLAAKNVTLRLSYSSSMLNKPEQINLGFDFMHITTHILLHKPVMKVL